MPRHALRFDFPALWPEAEQDEGFLSGAVGVPVVKARRRGVGAPWQPAPAGQQ